jgi:hypothetical protein|tara:strand:- start:6900 stop:7262 length:363 start_codon:yes stop_codon:yes gene_type:complete
MSLFNQGKASRMRSVYGHNTGTGLEVVYTCPANCVSEVTFIHLVNGATSGTTNVDVEWFVASANYTSHFLHGKSLAHSDYISFPDIDLILQAGDKIQVQPSSGGHLDTIITVTETFVPVG